MRKLILFFTAVSLALTMTSCLDGNQNFSEPNIVYIDQAGGGVIYGKTLNGRLITSDKMMLMEPGTFKFFHYSWEESYGYTQIDENLSANKVVIHGDVVDIKNTYLEMMPVTEVEEPLHFNEIRLPPVYHSGSVLFGDKWLFEYYFMGKEGEIPVVTFNKRNASEQSPNDIQIDIRITKTGTPKEGATEKIMGDLISLDMRALRQMFADQNNDLNIKFYYYVKDRQELQESPVYTMTIKN